MLKKILCDKEFWKFASKNLAEECIAIFFKVVVPFIRDTNNYTVINKKC